MYTPFASSEDVRDIVQRFESCEFAAGEFHHREHVTVALCYLLESTVEEALTRMRDGLLRFLKHQGATTAYHETITMFWIKRVRYFLDHADQTRSLHELANDLLSKCDDSKSINCYYSKEHLVSDEARRQWVEPDLKPLKF